MLEPEALSSFFFPTYLCKHGGQPQTQVTIVYTMISLIALQHPQPQLAISARNTTICVLVHLPDGRVITGSNDGTISIWSLWNGKQEWPPMEHKNAITDLAATRDGRKLISSNDYGSIRVWDIKAHELIQE